MKKNTFTLYKDSQIRRNKREAQNKLLRDKLSGTVTKTTRPGSSQAPATVSQKLADNNAGGVSAANVQVVKENPLTLSIKTLPPDDIGQALTNVTIGGSAAKNVPAPPTMKSNKVASTRKVGPKPSGTVKPNGNKKPPTPDAWSEEVSSGSDSRSRSRSSSKERPN